MTRDLVLGCVLLGMSAAYYLAAAAIPDSELSDAIGPAGLPSVYAILLASLALVLTARSLRARRASRAATSREPGDHPRRTPGRVAALLALGVLYIAAVPFTGYPIAIAALIVATALYHAGSAPAAGTSRRRHGTARVLLVGVAGAGLLWLVFVVLLRIPQPAGIWSTLW
jgi:hypothetical protein